MSFTERLSSLPRLKCTIIIDKRPHSVSFYLLCFFLEVFTIAVCIIIIKCMDVNNCRGPNKCHATTLQPDL